MVQLLRRKNFYFLSVETDLKINNKPSGVTSGLLWFVFFYEFVLWDLDSCPGRGRKTDIFYFEGALGNARDIRPVKDPVIN